VLRNDIVAKSTGTQRYTIDLELDGMLHASVRTNPKRGGSAAQYDTAAAEQMRGISAIVPVTNGIAVVADNTWRAIRAVNAIGCEWPDAPYPAEMADHWQAVSDSFTDDALDKEWRNDGDVDAALGADAQGACSRLRRSTLRLTLPTNPLSRFVLWPELLKPE
jgi:isoquinoline 1-oxidoreductase beta subunit